jgi:DegV family protein with EDD domain
MNVKIVTDSGCDLSKDHYNEFDIEMIPLSVHLDGEQYEDGKTIEPAQVYQAMKDGQSPKTSQVSLQAFQDVFLAYAEMKQPLLYIAFSSELSGTYQAAKLAEQEVKETYPEAAIYVLDSKCASLGHGLVVLHAAKLAKSGAPLEEIVKEASDQAEHMEHIFTVDHLEYLYRGGRVSRTAAFVGSLLNIKPLLHVDDGKLIPLEKIRGRKKVLKRMVDVMEDRGLNLEGQTIGISHGDDRERAEQLASLIKERFPVKDIEIEMIGAAIGAHSGPGTLALFFLNK